MLALLLSALAPAETALKPAAGVKPHIVMHLADDFGWANAVSSTPLCLALASSAPLLRARFRTSSSRGSAPHRRAAAGLAPP